MKRGKFSLSNTKLLSCDMGELIPIGLQEVLPGDTFNHSTNCLLRASPLLAPVMHPIDVRVHHWFVPHRLVWSEWEDFITGGPNGTSLPAFPVRAIGGGGSAIGSLSDYLGIPTGVGPMNVSVLPYRGYSMIWNEFYRDQDLQTELVVNLSSGVDATSNFLLQNVSWEKDYFTSARPWEQKGPAITVPIGVSAPVTRVANAQGWFAFNHAAQTQPAVSTPGGTATGAAGLLGQPTTANRWSLDPNGGLIADLSGASSITINALREAMALQRFEEARARYGSRYVEYLRSLGVRSSDARLSRPEYLGGGRQVIQFSEVLQTAEGTNPVGQLRGHGIAAMRSNRYRRFFEEHGYVFTLLSVRPKSIYANGLFRTWNKRVKEDFFQRELQHIGQQEILNKEVYMAHASPDAVFGYQDRYDEYRRSESSIAGEFRSSVLNFWHEARIFASAPALNASFVSCVPAERIFAVPANDTLYVMAKHSLQARRLVAQKGDSFIF